jgi:very-short-patch-repair endonuclease
MTTPSTPELLIADWLTWHQILFVTQQNMYGGVTESGGAKVDFLLPFSNIILRIQSYWHTLPEARARDEMQKAAMLNDGYIVVDIWETKLTANPDQVMRSALQGQELGE